MENYNLVPEEIPWAPASEFPLRSGCFSLYISSLSILSCFPILSIIIKYITELSDPVLSGIVKYCLVYSGIVWYSQVIFGNVLNYSILYTGSVKYIVFSL